MWGCPRKGAFPSKAVSLPSSSPPPLSLHTLAFLALLTFPFNFLQIFSHFPSVPEAPGFQSVQLIFKEDGASWVIDWGH